MVTVIDAVADVTVLPKLSCTATVGGPPIVLPAVEFAGCVLKTTLLAATAVMLNALVVAPVNPVEEAVSV